MKNGLYSCLSILLLSSASGTLQAQSSAYHPALTDNFTLTLGAMRSSNSFTMESDTIGDIGDDIDFDDSVGVSDHSTFFHGQLRWKFGKQRKWSLFGQYFSNNAEGGAVLEEDLEWDGDTFREGTFVGAGVKLAVTRVFFGRSFVKNEQHDFGIGAGIHNLEIKTFLEGEVLVNDETTGFQRDEVDASQILPNIGGWYDFSPAQKWLIHARVDWISANIGDYDGHLWNTSIGVNYQAFEHVGFDLAWQYFNLNLNVDSDDWTGGADMTYSGPVLSVTANW